MRRTQNGGLLARDTIQLKDGRGRVVRTLTCTFLEPVSERLLSREEREQFSSLQGLADIGLYFGMHTKARRMEYFSFDYSSAGPQGEPQISLVENTGPGVIEISVIAENFEEFARMLVKKPKASTFDFDELKELLAKAAHQAWGEFLETHGGENINGFTLYIDERATTVSAAANTAERL